MSWTGGRTTVEFVRILIEIDQMQPPAGTLKCVGEDRAHSDSVAVPFTGWLDLMRTLEQAVGARMRTAGGDDTAG